MPFPGVTLQKVPRFLFDYRRSAFIAALILFLVPFGFFVGRVQESSSIVDNPNNESRFAKYAGLLISPKRDPEPPIYHPIPKLMDDAEAQYENKLKSQSKTLQAAVEEYKQRYKRAPPKGFDEWFRFAYENDFQMMDEFNGLMGDLEPFWALAGEELRRRCKQVANLPSIDLVMIENGEANVKMNNHSYQDLEESASAFTFVTMLQRFIQQLPDMEFPINAKSESRVILSWEARSATQLNATDDIVSVLGREFTPKWDDGGTVWNLWRSTCPPTSPARRGYSSVRNASISQVKSYFGKSGQGRGRDFRFIKNTSAQQINFCAHPYAHRTQGHFFSNWRTIPTLYPVFSPAKATGFMDIRIPSHYYYTNTSQFTYGWDPASEDIADIDPLEVPWKNKADKIFWRGATTGGGNSPPGFAPQYHRHRFVRMASEKGNTNRSVTYADPPSSTTEFVTTQVSTAKLNEEIMDVAFTEMSDSDSYPGGQDALKASYPFARAVPLGKRWSYRYLLDLDGTSYSGRFMALLASNSVPIKATVYEEFFTDWIQPWVHFIPLSTSYKEIYNIFTYFTGPTKATLEAANSTLAEVPIDQRDGDKRLKKIAQAGRLWKKKMGRAIDMEVYVYRLCLEWARLRADDRDAMSFDL